MSCSMIDRLKISPSLDGVDHINIHSNAATLLGRLLCDLANTPFVHPQYGRFESLEGYRHWCRTGKQYDVLKELWGQHAKIRGGKFKEVLDPHLEQNIIEGIHCKLLQTEGLLEDLQSSVLPLVCYFVFDTNIRLLKSGKLLTKELTRIRAGKPLLFK